MPSGHYGWQLLLLKMSGAIIALKFKRGQHHGADGIGWVQPMSRRHRSTSPSACWPTTAWLVTRCRTTLAPIVNRHQAHVQTRLDWFWASERFCQLWSDHVSQFLKPRGIGSIVQARLACWAIPTCCSWAASPKFHRVAKHLMHGSTFTFVWTWVSAKCIPRL